MIIYKITNKLNGKCYVGQTRYSLNKRWAEHCCPTQKRPSRVISEAIKKYGKDTFSVDVVAECGNLDDLNNAEEYYIEFFNSMTPNGYNLKAGGDSKRHSEESKKKMSEAHMGKKNHFFGKHHSEENRKIMSIHKKGKPLSEEHKKKIGIAGRGRIFTDEHKRKIAVAHLGKPKPRKNRS